MTTREGLIAGVRVPFGIAPLLALGALSCAVTRLPWEIDGAAAAMALAPCYHLDRAE